MFHRVVGALAGLALISAAGMAAAQPAAAGLNPKPIPGFGPAPKATGPGAPTQVIKVHGKSLEGNVEGEAVDRDVVVFSGEDTRRARPIALKVLRGEFARDAEFVAAVRAQSRALARSAHVLRGVQRVYEAGDTQTGQLFVALEWVEGATLSDMLDTGGALAVPTALRVAIRVGEALEALQSGA